MRQVEYHRYYLPPGPGRRAPHLSAWVMTAEEAAARGAIRPEPSSRELRMLPETEEEARQLQVHYPSAGHGGVKPPPAR